MPSLSLLCFADLVDIAGPVPRYHSLRGKNLAIAHRWVSECPCLGLMYAGVGLIEG